MIKVFQIPIACLIAGLGGGVLMFFLNSWQQIKPELAEGREMLWLSIGTFVLFLLWQIKGFWELFTDINNRRARTFVLSFFGSILVIGLGIFTVAFFGGDEVRSSELLIGITGNLDTMPKPEDLNIIQIILMFLLQLIGTALFVSVAFSILMLGRIGLGASLSVALHNWFNGAGFNFSEFIQKVFVDVFSEASLNDISGLIVGFIWLFITNVILKSGGGSVVDG